MQISISITPQLHDVLKQSAVQNCRSISQEITYHVTQSMGLNPSSTPLFCPNTNTKSASTSTSNRAKHIGDPPHVPTPIEIPTPVRTVSLYERLQQIFTPAQLNHMRENDFAIQDEQGYIREQLGDQNITCRQIQDALK